MSEEQKKGAENAPNNPIEQKQKQTPVATEGAPIPAVQHPQEQAGHSSTPTGNVPANHPKQAATATEFQDASRTDTKEFKIHSGGKFHFGGRQWKNGDSIFLTEEEAARLKNHLQK